MKSQGDCIRRVIRIIRMRNSRKLKILRAKDGKKILLDKIKYSNK